MGGASDVIDEALISAIEAAHDTGAGEWRGHALQRLANGRICLWIEGNWIPFPSDEAIASYLMALDALGEVSEVGEGPDAVGVDPSGDEPEFEADAPVDVEVAVSEAAIAEEDGEASDADLSAPRARMELAVAAVECPQRSHRAGFRLNPLTQAHGKWCRQPLL